MNVKKWQVMTDSRLDGIARLYGNAEKAFLQQQHVVVVGIGGVGSWVAEALARTGIGQLTLIDLDDVCVSNINRQLHALTSTVGQSKVEVMATRIKDINPSLQVNTVEDFLTLDNLSDYITKDADYVVDAIDAVTVKAGLIAHCKRGKIPIITTGGAGGQRDPSLIQVADVTKTIQDPLMSKVRSILRRDYNFSRNPKRKFGIDCVFSTEQLRYPNADGSVCMQKSSREGSASMDCQTGFGAVTMVTASFGFFAAARVVDKLTARFAQQ